MMISSNTKNIQTNDHIFPLLSPTANISLQPTPRSRNDEDLFENDLDSCLSLRWTIGMNNTVPFIESLCY